MYSGVCIVAMHLRERVRELANRIRRAFGVQGSGCSQNHRLANAWIGLPRDSLRPVARRADFAKVIEQKAAESRVGQVLEGGPQQAVVPEAMHQQDGIRLPASDLVLDIFGVRACKGRL